MTFPQCKSNRETPAANKNSRFPHSEKAGIFTRGSTGGMPCRSPGIISTGSVLIIAKQRGKVNNPYMINIFYFQHPSAACKGAGAADDINGKKGGVLQNQFCNTPSKTV
jgi:hypothetical protein